MPERLVRLARTEEIPEMRSRLFKLEGEEIAVWRVGGNFYAINNVCPHQHFSKLHEGTLDGLFLTCPMHGWTFSLEDGHARTGNGRARVYKLRIEHGEILIGVPLEPESA
jgi:nitrite reductase/ring-hydroxylating ferredoxin subunit